MPRLDQRLKTVARLIRARTHADIGSDHGHLLKALLKAGRIEHGIAIENKSLPYANSTRTLAGLNAEVRLADGLAGLEPEESDSLSICGLGGRVISRILEAHPARIPPVVIVQPNRRSELVRGWGLAAGYRLVDEHLSPESLGRVAYEVLHFQRFAQDSIVASSTAPLIDPAYEGLDMSAALLFGPHLIRRREPRWIARLEEEAIYLQTKSYPHPEAILRLAMIRKLLDR